MNQRYSIKLMYDPNMGTPSQVPDFYVFDNKENKEVTCLTDDKEKAERWCNYWNNKKESSHER